VTKDEIPKTHLVVVVHGIRDRGQWFRIVQDVLEDGTDVRVVPISFGYFDIFRFLVPSPLRRGPIEFVRRELLNVAALAKDEGKRLSVIAHSYGTYAVTKVIEEQRELEIDNLVLCGAIVPRTYDWGASRRQVRSLIVNDYGVKDPWPVVATSVTWGFGDSGTYGFTSTNVDRDRDHDFGHGGFMDATFVETFWKPLLHLGRIVPPDRSKGGYPKQPPWFGVLGLPWKYLIALGVAAALGAAIWPDVAGDLWYRASTQLSRTLGWSADSRNVPLEQLLSVSCDVQLMQPSAMEKDAALESARFLKTEPWLKLALDEVGQAEVPGDANNPRIIAYNRAISNGHTNDETPWNGQFVQWALITAGHDGLAGGLAQTARNWLNFGYDVDDDGIGPIAGAVVVTERPEEPVGGVAGFYLGPDEQAPPDKPAIRMVAGNICGAVNVISVPESVVLGYRLPSDWQGPAQ
jgi:uncharacterized protein (TIGR02594 family)